MRRWDRDRREGQISRRSRARRSRRRRARQALSPTARSAGAPTGPLPAPSELPAVRSPTSCLLLDGEVCLGLDRAALDVRERFVSRRLRVGRNDRVELAVGDAVVRRAEEVVARLEGAALHRVRRVVDRFVHALHRARDYGPRRNIDLINVDTDCVDALLLRGRDVAEARATGDLEEDVAVLADVIQPHFLALLLVNEVVAVPVEDGGAWVDRRD